MCMYFPLYEHRVCGAIVITYITDETQAFHASFPIFDFLSICQNNSRPPSRWVVFMWAMGAQCSDRQIEASYIHLVNYSSASTYLVKMTGLAGRLIV